MAERRGPPQPRGADLGQLVRIPFQPLGAELPARPLVIGVEKGIFAAIGEHQPVVAIDKRLGRRAVGEDHIVLVEFEVEVFDPIDAVLLHDRRAVDQMLGLHQYAIDI